MKTRHFSREFQKIFSLIRTRLIGGGMILLYHGITDPSGVFDPFSLCVSPENFEEHLSILCRDAHPMGLEEMAQKLKNGGLPPRAVAITFDDGYADNFYLAKPLLEKFKIPATVFVITGFLGDTFWWDDLTRIILQPEKLPQRLSLKLDGSIYQSSLHNKDENSRLSLIRELHQFLRLLSSGQQQLALQYLSNWAGFVPENQSDHRPLKIDELKTLADSELIAIGAHTVTHPALVNLPPSKQREEIVNCKVFLENVLDDSIKSFSYPFGLKSDYSNETINIVREAGFSCACSNEIDTVWSKSDLYQLPRYWVKNWPGSVFEKHLQMWLPG